MIYYKQLGWASSSYKFDKNESVQRFEKAKNEGWEIKFPEQNPLFYLVDDIKRLGLWSGESSLNDQALFYYSQLYKIELDDFECDIIKQCSRAYVDSYRTNNNTTNPAPYAPVRTQEEVDAKDQRLLDQRNKRLNNG